MIFGLSTCQSRLSTCYSRLSTCYSRFSTLDNYPDSRKTHLHNKLVIAMHTDFKNRLDPLHDSDKHYIWVEHFVCASTDLSKKNRFFFVFMIGNGTTDLRYPKRWPDSLKNFEESGRKVFIPLLKLSQDLQKCCRCIVACSRKFFTEKNISRNSYIGALHCPRESGFTEEFPDPLKANMTSEQASRALVKRKAPAERVRPVTKAAKKTVLTNK